MSEAKPPFQQNAGGPNQSDYLIPRAVYDRLCMELLEMAGEIDRLRQGARAAIVLLEKDFNSPGVVISILRDALREE